MIFDYAVIHNGVFYAAGEDVPMEPKLVAEDNDPEQITLSEVVEQNPIIEDIKSVLGEPPAPKKRSGRPRKNK